MAFHHGNEGTAMIAANEIAEIQDWTYDENDAAVLEKTSIGDTAAGYVASGCKVGGGTVNVLWDETDTNGQGAMTVGASVTLNLYPEGNTSGDVYFAGSVIIEKRGLASSKDGFTTQGFDYKGVLTESTVS